MTTNSTLTNCSALLPLIPFNSKLWKLLEGTEVRHHIRGAGKIIRVELRKNYDPLVHFQFASGSAQIPLSRTSNGNFELFLPVDIAHAIHQAHQASIDLEAQQRTEREMELEKERQRLRLEQEQYWQETRHFFFDGYEDFKSASDYAKRLVTELGIDVTVRRSEDHWSIEVAEDLEQTVAACIEWWCREEEAQSRDKGDGHYLTCEEEDAARAHDEHHLIQNEIHSELSGDLDSYSTSDDAGWFYTDDGKA